MTGPEWYMVDMFTEFAALMVHEPWYKYPFMQFVAQMRDVMKHSVEHERKKGVADVKAQADYEAMDKGLVTANSVLFRGMQLGADLVQRSLKGQTVHPKTYFVVRISPEQWAELPKGLQGELTPLQNGLMLGSSDRYMPFTQKMRELAANGISPVDVAGNTRIAVVFTTKSAKVPEELTVPHAMIESYKFPTAEFPGARGISTETFHRAEIDVSDSAAFVKQADKLGMRIVRFHDF
jgi:hypothetical protein